MEVVSVILLLIVIIEICYWGYIFPKAWKDGSNREIEDIKYFLNSDK
jgi:hypothetical protein